MQSLGLGHQTRSCVTQFSCFTGPRSYTVMVENREQRWVRDDYWTLHDVKISWSIRDRSLIYFKHVRLDRKWKKNRFDGSKANFLLYRVSRLEWAATDFVILSNDNSLHYLHIWISYLILT